MISLEELNPHQYALDSGTLRENMNLLFEVMNKIRAKYGKPMTVTSGFRSAADQERINPKAPHSAHRLAGACDIADPDGSLWHWCLDELDFLESLGVHLESKAYTPTWVHFQVIRPVSGVTIFIP